ncbi:MAG: hypothetical protein ACRDGV_13570 [Candidatus Limnocylindria bacterium]
MVPATRAAGLLLSALPVLAALWLTAAWASPAAATDDPVLAGTEEAPVLNITKAADADPIGAGETAVFTITVWNAGPGDAFDVTVTDELPDGVSWAVDVQDPDDDDACALSGTVEGDVAFSCELGILPVTDMAGGKVIVVSGETGPEACGALDNTAFVNAGNADEPIGSSASITVSCPTLVIDKAADADLITIDGDGASPSVITWTLSYAVGGGPVSNAVITDPIPAGFDYLAGSASDGGVFDAPANAVTWTFPTLTESGSVTFQTTVDVETISRTTPTANIAVISSDQTADDDGRDDVRVAVEPPPLGGTSAPAPTATPAPAQQRAVPDTAVAINADSVATLPLLLVVALVVGSLGAIGALARRR